MEERNYCSEEQLQEDEVKEEENLDAEVAQWNEQEEEDHKDYIPMDFTLETPEERKKKVEEIISQTPPERLTPKYLEKLADYIVFAMDKQERKNKKILTDNRMVTINKRETSFEGLVGKLENGEDGIYNMIANDKNIIFQPKVSITEQDIAEIPGLKELRKSIEELEATSKNARGRKAYLLKKNIIELRQDQYVLKNIFKKPIFFTNTIKSFSKINLSERVYLDEKNEVHSTGLINLYNPTHVSAILCNYSKLKEDSWSNFSSDAKWLLVDFEELVDATLKEKYPLYYDLVIYKIDGKQNIEIQQLLNEKHGVKHSVEYISSLWRNKIPKLIAEKAANDWLIWHFTMEEKGKWKRCSRCGQVKLAHNHFFSINKTSKDGFYSICKECRNSKTK